MTAEQAAPTHTRRVAGNLSSDFLAAVNERLIQLGLRRARNGYDIWMQPVATGVSAWVGVVPRSYGESLGVLVTVGARHEVIELALRELWPELAQGTGSTTKVGATIATNVQELLPEPVRGPIYVDGRQFIEPAAATVAERVQGYGLPFARSVVTLPALIDAWGQHARPTTVYRRPIALYVNGDADGARADLQATLKGMEGMSGAIKDQFEAFAGEFFARMSTLPALSE